MIACVRCGSPVDQRAVFCGICGQSRVAAPPVAAPGAPSPVGPAARTGMQPVIAVLLGLILLVAIATVAFFVGRGTTDRSAPAAASGPAQTAAAPAPTVTAAPPITPAAAGEPARPDIVRARCIVIDDSGTPLNVRATPNGRILGGLLYGHSVEVVEVSLSRNGRYWSRINVNNPIYRSGWVLSALIDCETVGP